MFDTAKVAGPPTPDSAALLLGLDTSELDQDAAYEVVLAAERLVRAAQAVQNEAMLGLIDEMMKPEAQRDKARIETYRARLR